MNKIIPQKLKKGDEIRVIAPSRNMNILSDETIDIAKESLERLGFKVTFGKNVNNSINDEGFIDTTTIFFNAFIALLIGQLISSSKNKKRNTIIYLGLWGILFVIINIYFASLIMFLILNIIFFTLGRLGIINVLRLSGGGFYGGSGSSRGGSSRGGGFSGGGGSFRGGGASGRF